MILLSTFLMLFPGAGAAMRFTGKLFREQAGDGFSEEMGGTVGV
ncbi:MAG: hypothetical protein ACLT0L_12100 [Akkermansia sp.]|nr:MULTISPECIES: hypothetical protein [unclassified Akkermansia]